MAPTARTKRRKRQRVAELNIKAASYHRCPSTHIVFKYISEVCRNAFCPDTDHPRRIWNLFRALKWCTPEISSPKQKGSKMTLCHPLEKEPGLCRALRHCRHIWFEGHSYFGEPGVPSPKLLPKKCPDHLNKMVPEWSQYLLAHTSSCVFCYSRWVLHSDRGCQ